MPSKHMTEINQPTVYQIACHSGQSYLSREKKTTKQNKQTTTKTTKTETKTLTELHTMNKVKEKEETEGNQQSPKLNPKNNGDIEIR